MSLSPRVIPPGDSSKRAKVDLMGGANEVFFVGKGRDGDEEIVEGKALNSTVQELLRVGVVDGMLFWQRGSHARHAFSNSANAGSPIGVVCT